MFSMTKSRQLDEGQSRYLDLNKRHYDEDVKFYLCMNVCSNNQCGSTEYVLYVCVLYKYEGVGMRRK